mmetsp:Transcript_28504/g.73069  ORF Transcript_28504/g.73069 Transcript_28504/m.73069 type:complete len:204 (+) Transcript_28504:1003-1614(+)
MQVRVRAVGHVIIDDDVDTLDINATTPNVCRHQDAMFEILEILVHLDAFLLLHRSVDRNRGEVALLEELVKLDGALHRLDKNYDLVELECVEQLIELTILLVLSKLYVVLLQAMQCELGIIDVDLHRILHEFLAHGPHIIAEGGGEHHHLCGKSLHLAVASVDSLSQLGSAALKKLPTSVVASTHLLLVRRVLEYLLHIPAHV